MVAKVNSVAAEFRKVSDIQMAETTKRAIRENVSINQQLSKMSDKTIAFIRENEQLKQKEKDLIRKVEILEYSNQELTRKNVSCQKVLRLMRDKVGEREAWNSELEQKAIRCTLMEQDLRLAHEDVSAKDREIAVGPPNTPTSPMPLPYPDLVPEKLRQEFGRGTSSCSSSARQDHSRTRFTPECCKQCFSSYSRVHQGELQSKFLESTPDSIEQVQKPDSGAKPRRDNLLSTLLQLLKFEPGDGLDEETPTVVKYQPGDLGFVPTAAKSTTTTRAKPKTALPPINNKNPSISSLIQHQA